MQGCFLVPRGSGAWGTLCLLFPCAHHLGFTTKWLISAYECFRDSVALTCLLRIRHMRSWETNVGLTAIDQNHAVSQWEGYCIAPHPLPVHLVPPCFLSLRLLGKYLFMFYDFTNCSWGPHCILICLLPSSAPLICGAFLLATVMLLMSLHLSFPKGVSPMRSDEIQAIISVLLIPLLTFPCSHPYIFSENRSLCGFYFMSTIKKTSPTNRSSTFLLRGPSL